MKHKEQIERTLKYVRCLAEGTDPVTGEPATKETLDRPQTIRCFLFIEKILSEMIAKKKKKPSEPYPIEKLSDFSYEEDCGIVKLLNKLKKLVPDKHDPLKMEDRSTRSGKTKNNNGVNKYKKEIQNL